MENNTIAAVAEPTIEVPVSKYEKLVNTGYMYNTIKKRVITMIKQGKTRYQIQEALNCLLFGVTEWEEVQELCGYVEKEGE